MAANELAALRGALCRPELPPAFERWQTTLSPGGQMPAPEGWAEALVLVERGEVEVCCEGGSVKRFAQGCLMAPGWLGVRWLRNPGPRDLALVSVRRRPPGTASTDHR